MKTEVVSEKKRTAKTMLPCNACEWLKKSLNDEFIAKLDPDEKQAVEKAVARRYMIIPGVQYMEYVTKYNGVDYTTNVLIKIHDICTKYKVYPWVQDAPSVQSNLN